MSAPDDPQPAGDQGRDTPGDELEWLFSLQAFGVKPGLATTRALLAAVGEPQRSLNVVLVAGTNGKGSVATLLAACLQAAGRRTGTFVSPHLQRVGERAMVDGVEASPAEFRRALAVVRPHATRLQATFFEVVTVAALLRFREAGVRWAVMEVGLGGRFDATNALEPSLSLITAVGLDHMAILGPDLATIAGEKAGILRPGVPALTSASGAALHVISERAGELGAPLLALYRDLRPELLGSGWDGIEIALALPDPAALRRLAPPGEERLAPRLPAELRLRSPLLGRHQVDNVALAALAALVLGVEVEQVRSAIAATRWPGRLEVIEYRQRRFVLDGAHNPQAAEALAAALKELAADVATLILGLSSDKDAHGVLAPLVELSGMALATRAAHSPRASDPHELAARLTEMRADLEVEVALDPAAALERALQSTAAGATVVVAGSLFLVGEMRSLLKGESGETSARWQ